MVAACRGPASSKDRFWTTSEEDEEGPVSPFHNMLGLSRNPSGSAGITEVEEPTRRREEGTTSLRVRRLACVQVSFDASLNLASVMTTVVVEASLHKFAVRRLCVGRACAGFGSRATAPTAAAGTR